MKKEYKFLLFIVINFLALYIGSFLSQNGPSSDWYQSLNKAPWTPPGWVFGLAWTSIMVCYSFYMAILYKSDPRGNKVITLYAVQLFLNIAWNPLFFYFQYALIALFCILFLTIIIAYFLFRNNRTMRWYSLLILPYFLWLCIATSLNFYIVIYN